MSPTSGRANARLLGLTGRRDVGVAVQGLLQLVLGVLRQRGLENGPPVARHRVDGLVRRHLVDDHEQRRGAGLQHVAHPVLELPDRKSTRLNSSHANISYAVFCLKKKKRSLHMTILILLHAYGDASHIAYLRIRLLYSASQLHTP